MERDILIALDFDADGVCLVSQQFWLFWTDPADKPRSHAPDHFARLADGSARVLHYRPRTGSNRATKPRSTPPASLDWPMLDS